MDIEWVDGFKIQVGSLLSFTEIVTSSIKKDE